MARPAGTSNNMRTPEEKEKIVLEMINSGVGFYTISKKYGMSKSVISNWYYSYKTSGLNGLNSNTGKKSTGRHKSKGNEVERLKEELLKKEIEIMRLKKGYMVKGAGAKKEYVSISDLTIK